MNIANKDKVAVLARGGVLAPEQRDRLEDLAGEFGGKAQALNDTITEMPLKSEDDVKSLLALIEQHITSAQDIRQRLETAIGCHSGNFAGAVAA